MNIGITTGYTMQLEKQFQGEVIFRDFKELITALHQIRLCLMRSCQTELKNKFTRNGRNWEIDIMLDANPMNITSINGNG